MGQSLSYLIRHPEEVALWERRFKKRPPAVWVTNTLLARIGVMLEVFMGGRGSDESIDSWFFWQNDASNDDAGDSARFAATEADLEADRRAMLESMGS